MTAACGNDSSAASSNTTASPSADSRSGGTVSASATPSSTPSSTPASSPADTPRCTRRHLTLSLGRISPAAGNLYAPLVFTNTGSKACTFRGYPGVSLLDSSGHRIGEPAKRRGPMRPAVVLDPGDSAYATLHTINNGLSDKPCWQPASRVQAYPPGYTWALRTDARSFQVCGNQFDVAAVRPGSHP
ncbi:DUF4232 domain-containing protein [Streptomyces sp. 7R007]